MVKVHLWTGLRRFTDGQTVVEVEAATVGTMLKALVAQHPGLAPVIEAGISVAIDGDIIGPQSHCAVGPENEIYLLQQMRGG